tara:strand:- start:28887 stop:29285 length:399 start_codon:yes stop_codon:yes gene_type:complete
MGTFRAVLLSITLALPFLAHAQLGNMLDISATLSGVEQSLVLVTSLPLLDPSMIEQNASSGLSLLSTFMDPSKSLAPVLGLGTGVLGAVSPAANVLLTAPVDLPAFLLLDGGAILSAGLGGIPAIPLLNSPL